MRGVGRGTFVAGLGGESCDQLLGGAAAAGGRTDQPEVVLPAGPGCVGEHRRRNRGQGRVVLLIGCLRAQYQVRSGSGDGSQIGGTGQTVHDGAQVGRLAGRTVRQGGSDDA